MHSHTAAVVLLIGDSYYYAPLIPTITYLTYQLVVFKYYIICDHYLSRAKRRSQTAAWPMINCQVYLHANI